MNKYTQMCSKHEIKTKNTLIKINLDEWQTKSSSSVLYIQCKCSVSKVSGAYRCSVYTTLCCAIHSRGSHFSWLYVHLYLSLSCLVYVAYIVCAWKRRIHHTTYSGLFFPLLLLLLFNNETKKTRKRKKRRKPNRISFCITHAATQRVKHGIRAAVVISSSYVHIHIILLKHNACIYIYYLFNVHRCTSVLWFQKKWRHKAFACALLSACFRTLCHSLRSNIEILCLRRMAAATATLWVPFLRIQLT